MKSKSWGERYLETHPFIQDRAFGFWIADLMDRLKVGGIFIGGKWHSTPKDFWDYSWVINKIIPNNPDDMALFCQCKLRVEIFILAILGQWKIISNFAEKEAR